MLPSSTGPVYYLCHYWTAALELKFKLLHFIKYADCVNSTSNPRTSPEDGGDEG